MINKVEICGVDTSKLPLIPESELKGYFEKIHTGDKTAREEFVRGNLRLVLSVCRRFAMRHENMDDLFQVGCVGLLKAVDNFDLSQNVRFSTYAVPMIIGEIRRYLRDNNAIRVSRSLRDTANHAFIAINRFSADNGREPTIEEISAILSLPKEEVVFALDAVREPVSLSQPLYQEGSDALYIEDSVADDRNSDERWQNSIALHDAVDRLPERERNIIELRYFEGKTQVEVAKEISISQAQVSRLEKSAIAQISRSYV